MFTSTTSAFGRALAPPPGAPAAWITEDVTPVPRNVYGVTKTAAEDLCELVHRDHGLPVVILRTSRFFPEADDRDDVARRVRRRQPQGERAALPPRRPRGRRRRPPAARSARAAEVGFGRYIVSATTPFTRGRPCRSCATDAPAVVRRLFPGVDAVYGRARLAAAGGARTASTTTPAPASSSAGRRAGTSRYALERVAAGEEPRSALAVAVGAKGYHAVPTGIYTTR